MLYKDHPHFDPLRRSYYYFSFTGTILFYLGSKVLPGVLSAAFNCAGVFSIVLGLLAFNSIIANKPMQYHGVFSLDTQRKIRIAGFFLPFLLVGVLLGGDWLYNISGCRDKVDDSNRWIMFERLKATKVIDTHRVKEFSNRVTTLMLAGPSESLSGNIMRLSDQEVSSSLVFSMKRMKDKHPLMALSRQLPPASQITSLSIDDPVLEGLTKQHNFLKVRAKFRIYHSGEKYSKPISGSFVYHIGIRTRSSYKGFVVAKIIPEIKFDQPNDCI